MQSTNQEQERLHPDAYKLITYRSEDTATAELVWNSRNNAAPKTILLRDGRTARRVKVHEPFLPSHVPAVGHLVLVDCTVEWADERAEHLAERMWSAGMHEGCADQDELEARIFNLFAIDVESHYGIAVEVTTEMATAHGWLVSA